MGKQALWTKGAASPQQLQPTVRYRSQVTGRHLDAYEQANDRRPRPPTPHNIKDFRYGTNNPQAGVGVGGQCKKSTSQAQLAYSLVVLRIQTGLFYCFNCLLL